MPPWWTGGPPCRICCARQYSTPLSSSSTLALRASAEGEGPGPAPAPLPSPCAAAKVRISPGLCPRASVTAVEVTGSQINGGWAQKDGAKPSQAASKPRRSGSIVCLPRWGAAHPALIARFDVVECVIGGAERLPGAARPSAGVDAAKPRGLPDDSNDHKTLQDSCSQCGIC